MMMNDIELDINRNKVSDILLKYNTLLSSKLSLISNERPFDQEPLRVYAISDLHVDNSSYRSSLNNLITHWEFPLDTNANDCLILAGDISHDLGKIEWTLKSLLTIFRKIFYVVGNHELWNVSSSSSSSFSDCASLEKLMKIILLCEKLGVFWYPAKVSPNVTIVPLLSWYEHDFGSGSQRDPTSLETGFDCYCKFPINVLRDVTNQKNNEISGFMAKMNLPILDYFKILNGDDKHGKNQNENVKATEEIVISFSHFVPDPRLYPGRQDIVQVMGSNTLLEHIKTIGSSIHVFGHSHINTENILDGVKYFQSSLGQKWFPTIFKKVYGQ